MILCILILLEIGGKGGERRFHVELTYRVPGTLLSATFLRIRHDVYRTLAHVTGRALVTVVQTRNEQL